MMNLFAIHLLLLAEEMPLKKLDGATRAKVLSALAGLIIPYPTRSEAAKRAAASFFAPRLFTPRTKSLVRLLARLP